MGKPCLLGNFLLRIGMVIPQQKNGTVLVRKDAQEAVFALVSLGISNSDAVKIVADVSKTEKGAENIIREALKRL